MNWFTFFLLFPFVVWFVWWVMLGRAYFKDRQEREDYLSSQPATKDPRRSVGGKRVMGRSVTMDELGEDDYF